MTVPCPTPCKDGRDRGLSLIELVVAMAVFALIAVMGVQALSGMLRGRDRLTEMSQQTAEMGQALAVLRHDLGAVVPALFFPAGPTAPQSPLRLGEGNSVLSLSLAGQPVLGQGAQMGAMQRVEWRFDPSTGQLTRASWPTLIPAEAASRGPDVLMLEGVEGLQLRTYWQGTGWQSGVQPPGSTGGTVAADADLVAGSFAISTTLPLAIEVTLRTQAMGDIALIEALQ